MFTCYKFAMVDLCSINDQIELTLINSQQK